MNSFRCLFLLLACAPLPIAAGDPAGAQGWRPYLIGGAVGASVTSLVAVGVRAYYRGFLKDFEVEMEKRIAKKDEEMESLRRDSNNKQILYEAEKGKRKVFEEKSISLDEHVEELNRKIGAYQVLAPGARAAVARYLAKRE